MQSNQEQPVVKIAPNNPVFDLPVIVGIEEGLFATAGLDVRFSATYADREKDNAEAPVMSRLKEQLFDCGSADSYNVCEWASIDRLERGTRGGNIAALRAAVAAQAILAFDDALQAPRDLADVPVLVQELTGSHYTTLQMLESAVGRRACQDRAGRAAADALCGAQGSHRARDHGDGALHQPRPQGGRPHHRGLVLSRRRGDRARSDARSSARPITTPRTRRSISSMPISTNMPTTSRRTPRARLKPQRAVCARSCATSTSTTTIRRCSAAPMTG